MSLREIEWVLVVFYGKSAHRATYGRLSGTTYTKDYIQLSRKPDFLEDLKSVFPSFVNGGPPIQIVYKWPGGTAEGQLIPKSADRPHLAWETDNAPSPWRMNPAPSEGTTETIVGNPAHQTAADADAEFDQLMVSGTGQPYLVAVKLRGEEDTLHLRVQIANPASDFKWADINNAPQDVIELAGSTSRNSALAWKFYDPAQDSEFLFDPNEKASPWKKAGSEEALPKPINDGGQSNLLHDYAPVLDSDAIAESLDTLDAEVSDFEKKVDDGSYEVPDTTTTAKTRGSAQRVFSERVKENYGWRCAVTGISSREFLIASHIVPWSIDEKIRLDPSNGICLSVLVDRAFEHGFLSVLDDLTIKINWEKVGEDQVLVDQIGAYDGAKLTEPKQHSPKVEYLQRRRSL